MSPSIFNKEFKFTVLQGSAVTVQHLRILH